MSFPAHCGEVFSCIHLCLHVQAPQLDQLGKDLVDGEGVELLQPLVGAVRNALRIGVLCHRPGDILEHLKALDTETGILLIALVNRILQRREILEDILAELCTLKARQCCTRLERNLDAVNSDDFLDSHIHYPPNQSVVVAATVLLLVVDAERVPVLLLVVAAVGIYTALYQLL